VVSGVPVIITGSRGMMLHARDLAGVISIFRAMPRSISLAEPLTYLMAGTSHPRSGVKPLSSLSESGTLPISIIPFVPIRDRSRCVSPEAATRFSSKREPLAKRARVI